MNLNQISVKYKKENINQRSKKERYTIFKRFI